MKKINCILCQSSSKTVIQQQAFEDEYLTLIDPELNKLDRTWVECNNCGLIYHDPQLESSETHVLYEKFRDVSFRGEVADEYFDRIVSISREESENYAKVAWLSRQIPDYLNKGGRILDIGSGGGVFLYTFLQNNKTWEPHGVEPTVEFAELTQRKLNCPVYAGNYTKESFYEKFDLITCNQVLEHTTHPMEFLNHIFNDLNTGGYLYIEVPDILDFEDLPAKHDRFLAQHLWYFSKEVMKKMVEDVGFTVVKMESQKTIRERNNLVSLLFKE